MTTSSMFSMEALTRSAAITMNRKRLRSWDTSAGFMRKSTNESVAFFSDVNLDETLVCIVSDHGFSAIEWNPYLKHHLAKAGLVELQARL